MGNKIITEKDFWMCTGGIMPAQLQSTQLSTKKKDGKKYITLTDTATSSMMDFGCKWVMLIAAIIAAIAVVAIVATGGAGLAVLIAAGAAAGAGGAAGIGALLGGLICGQIARIARTWMGSKSNLIIQGQKSITGDHKMTCAIMGSEITFAPNIKNWWQAIAVGGVNYAGTVVMGGLLGMFVGMGAGVIGGLAKIAAPTLSSIGINIISSFGTLGSSVRAVFGIENTVNKWAMGNDLVSLDSGEAFFDGAIPEYESIKRIGTGNAEPHDAMMLLYLLHLKNPSVPKEKPVTEEQIVEEPVKNNNITEPEPVKKKGDGVAFEASPKPKNSPDVAKWEAKGGIVEVNGDTWKYTDWEGNVVEYKNGYPDFEPYSRQSVDIGKQKGDNYHDYKNAEKNSKEIPPKLSNEETTWHHHEDGKKMMEVDKKIHDRFSHKGGASKAKLGKK